MAKAKLTCDVSCINPRKTKALRSKMIDGPALAQLAQVFSVLGDQTRLKIVLLLANGRELCVCDIASVLDITVALASHHLRKLRDLGVLLHRQDSRLVYYSLSQEPQVQSLVRGVRRYLRQIEQAGDEAEFNQVCRY